jgi:hypothetical protein
MTPDEALRLAIEAARETVDSFAEYDDDEADVEEMYRTTLLNTLRANGFVIVRSSPSGPKASQD